MRCRHCQAELHLPFLDLGSAPPSNAYLTQDDLQKPELWFPLRILVCEECWLVQTEDYADRELLFSKEYAYFSSFSRTWLDHAKSYVQQVVTRFNLNAYSCVVEVAANDGYLLQYVRQAGIPNYGIEPTQSTALAARRLGIDIIEKFFGLGLAEELILVGRQADLMIANNVLAHVPDINEFVAAFARLLKPHGVVTFEFPHLVNMVLSNQFDTAYHEHYSYLSLTSVKRILESQGLCIFDVEEISTHGGSLRVFAQKTHSGVHTVGKNVELLLRKEEQLGVCSRRFYKGLQQRADSRKNELLKFLIDVKKNGNKLIAYGAAAKGNTLLNYAGVRPDLVPFVVDLNPDKQSKYLPGSRIPIVSGQIIEKERPDYILILPWNLRLEIMHQLTYVQRWGGKFVTAIPELTVL